MGLFVKGARGFASRLRSFSAFFQGWQSCEDRKMRTRVSALLSAASSRTATADGFAEVAQVFGVLFEELSQGGTLLGIRFTSGKGIQARLDFRWGIAQVMALDIEVHATEEAGEDEEIVFSSHTGGGGGCLSV